MPEINLIHHAIPFFVGLLALEAAVAAHQKRDLFRRADTLASLGLGLGNVIVVLFWKGFALGAYTAVHQWALFDIGTGAGAWIAVIVLDDLIYYWWHRLHHEIRFFWASHVTHHSSRRYNLSTALRQSWTSPLTSLPFYLPLAWLGFDPLMIVAAQSINLIYQFWVHTQLIDRLGPLEWVMNTPSHHRVHHGANVDYLDRNYAGILIIWDRLFGTFEPEVEAPVYGLTKNVRSYNPVYLAFHEFAAIFRDAMHAPDWRTALAFVFAPPGWSPDGSTLTAPQMRSAQNVTANDAGFEGSGAAAASR